jgi:hypothetical protein
MRSTELPIRGGEGAASNVGADQLPRTAGSCTTGPASIAIRGTVRSVLETPPIGTLELDPRTWQQDWLASILHERDCCIIWRQQSSCWAGIKHASAGTAAHRATTTSVSHALFLPTSTV